MSTFDSTKTSLRDLLKDISLGKIQLPDFQRGWVWDDDHIKSLLVSIARSFPVGAIMLLEAGGDAKFKERPIEGVQLAIPSRAEKLILDGQQRLTSLTQVLMCKEPVQTYDHKKKILKQYYYIDIERALLGEENYEDAIISISSDRILYKNFGRDIELDLSTEEKEFENFYFPCNQILDFSRWELGLINYDASKFLRYMTFRDQVIMKFHGYYLPIIELKNSNKKEAVCLVFEKVNTGGEPLTVFELMTATYAAENVNLRDEWFGNAQEGIKGIQKCLKEQSSLLEIQPTEFLQGLTLLNTWENRQEDINAGRTGRQIRGVTAKREAVLNLPLSAYLKWKDKLQDGYLKAAKFLNQESFFSSRDLPYRTQIVPLAAIMSILGNRFLEPKTYDKIARWLWCGILGELYGGSVETRMALDIQELIDWINGIDEEPSTIRDANFQPVRLGTLRSRNSAAYKGINVLIQREGAKDFFWKIAIKDIDKNEIDIHHIFPKRWCEDQGITTSRYNSILNKTPISYKANRMIGGIAPSRYLSRLQNHDGVGLDDAGMNEILEKHCIDSSALRADDFESFIKLREGLILKKIASVMGKPVLKADDSMFSDEDSDI
ncbi:DUF262 domain-containing protein (plasmid) [Pseudanabaena biceps]|nr:DUF262 domain-containing protein [Pseudanabaena biceps]